ncbi:MAG: hypothetical protein LBD80_00460 [Tannerella sp.]|jgi:hypothetical protein|nr:hypothetical protein [Tannerella sp.]
MKQLKREFLTLSMVFTAIVTASAQVTIGSEDAPDRRSVLELKSSTKAFLPPRIALIDTASAVPVGNTSTDHLAGLVLYNTTNDATKGLTPGLYYNNGLKWVRLVNLANDPKWFYMPSIPLKVSTQGTYTVNLWEEYKKQFDKSTPGNLIIASPGAPSSGNPLSAVYQAGELHYYVTGYDDKVFKNVTLTGANGNELVYEIDATSISNISDSTYMNIVLVVK